MRPFGIVELVRTGRIAMVRSIDRSNANGAGVSNSRAFDFANLASESISGVEVYKTSRAANPAGGIGATLNIKTARPLEAGNLANIGIKGVYDAGDNAHLSFVQGGGHGGSHPHLVHEFVSALVDNRDPYPNAVQSANWTCVGICAHESALKGGEIVKLPKFTPAFSSTPRMRASATLRDWNTCRP